MKTRPMLLDIARQTPMIVFEFGLTDGRTGVIELDFERGYMIKFEQHECGPYKTERIALEVLNRMKFQGVNQ